MIHKLNNYVDKLLTRQALYIIQKYGIMAILFAAPFMATAQNRDLTLKEAINLGLENSKVLKLSQSKIDEAISEYNEVKDKALPTGSASYVYNHAEIPTSKFQLPGNNKPLDLPARADAFIGTVSLQEVVFAGNKLKYAKESTELLKKVAVLDAEKDKEEIAYSISNAYFNLYKLQQSKKIVDQNILSIDKQVKQSQQFFENGIVTKNDVLRFQLQRSNIELTGLDLETNRKIVVYNLNVLLGLPENTNLIATGLGNAENSASMFAYIDTALVNRKEIQTLDVRSQVAETNIKSIKSDLSPMLLAGTNIYYINPSGSFIPPANSFLAPITIGATLAWNFDRLWTNKSKLATAKIQKTQVELNKSIVADNIRTEVNQNYQNYLKSLERVRILETSIAQARENDKILESKYNNNIASATDRIDAETQLYQSLINLELAKADEGLAYYTLLKSTGTLTRN